LPLCPPPSPFHPNCMLWSARCSSERRWKRRDSGRMTVCQLSPQIETITYSQNKISWADLEFHEKKKKKFSEKKSRVERKKVKIEH
jgi:hypothetical protein